MVVKIKTKIKTLKSFVDSVQMEGKTGSGSTAKLMENCLINCEGNKIWTEVCNVATVVLGKITYKNIDVLENGTIAIGSLEQFKDYLKRFEDADEVLVSVEENKIKIYRDSTPKKTAYLPLVGDDIVEDSVRAKNINLNSKITEKEGVKYFGSAKLSQTIHINTKLIQDVLDDGSVEGLDRRYPFEVSENGFSVKVGSASGGFIKTILSDSIIAPEKVISIFVAGIDNVFKNLEGEVVIHFGNNTPMLVIQNTDVSSFMGIIAPSTGEE